MKTKTIRISEERYNEICRYRKMLESDNNSRLTIDEVLDFIFTDYMHARAGAEMMKERLETEQPEVLISGS